MPFSRQLADIEQQINDLRAQLDAIRAQNLPAPDRFLSELARLNAERTRLMLRQSAAVIGK